VLQVQTVAATGENDWVGQLSHEEELDIADLYVPAVQELHVGGSTLPARQAVWVENRREVVRKLIVK
jgi:hypothetical protein